MISLSNTAKFFSIAALLYQNKVQISQYHIAPPVVVVEQIIFVKEPNYDL